MMTNHFSRPALICNSQSGGHDEDIMDTIAEICRASGAPLAATFALPDDDIPGAAELERRGIDLLLVWTGDGTINAAATKAAGWDGAVLPLPGGTRNLLAKELHGDRPVPAILSDALQGKGRRQPGPMTRSDGGGPYIHTVAGPAPQRTQVPGTKRQEGL